MPVRTLPKQLLHRGSTKLVVWIPHLVQKKTTFFFWPLGRWSGVLGCFSKCDFWNLWKILLRHSKKYFWKTFFRDGKFSWTNLEKKIVIFGSYFLLAKNFKTTENRNIFFSRFFQEKLSSRKKFFFENMFYYVEPKFSKDSKNRT